MFLLSFNEKVSKKLTKSERKLKLNSAFSSACYSHKSNDFDFKPFFSDLPYYEPKKYFFHHLYIRLSSKLFFVCVGLLNIRLGVVNHVEDSANAYPDSNVSPLCIDHPEVSWHLFIIVRDVDSRTSCATTCTCSSTTGPTIGSYSCSTTGPTSCSAIRSLHLTMASSKFSLCRLKKILSKK
jgi:hypothetical protein